MIARRRLLLAMGASMALPVFAREWPVRPMRIIVVYPTGGLSDGIARLIAERMSTDLGVPVRVENRPGDGGALGLQALARSAPDGHTLAFSAVSPLTLKENAVPPPGVEPVAGVMHTPVLVVGTSACTCRDFGELLAFARARPGDLRWATSGVGTSGHLVLEQVAAAAGVRITHVPYKGGREQITDALGGQFEVLSTNLAPEQVQLVRAGRLRALAVGAPRRVPSLPEVPTFAELGMSQANVASLFGLFAPGGTPPALLDDLHAAVQRALAQPELRERLVRADNLPATGDRVAFAREIAAQAQANAPLRARLAPRS